MPRWRRSRNGEVPIADIPAECAKMRPLKLRITELPVTPDRLLSWIRVARDR
jgi:hypothetical protein